MMEKLKNADDEMMMINVPNCSNLNETKGKLFFNFLSKNKFYLIIFNYKYNILARNAIDKPIPKTFIYPKAED